MLINVACKIHINSFILVFVKCIKHSNAHICSCFLCIWKCSFQLKIIIRWEYCEEIKLHFCMAQNFFNNWATNSRILEANLSWSPTWMKFYQLIASLSVILTQFYLTKNLSTWSLALSAKKKKYNTDENIFLSLAFDFFKFSSSCL